MAFAQQATLTVPAAPSGSHANFTVPFKISDAKLKPFANGGLVRNSGTMFTGSPTVPFDLIITSDLAATSLYNWYIESWDQINGIVYGAFLVTTYTTSSFPVYFNVGDAGVSTWMGGSRGSAFDTSVIASYPFPDGSTIYPVDFTSNAWDLTNNPTIPATASTGQINGGITVSGGGNLTSTSVNRTGIITLAQWVKPAVSNVYQLIQGKTLNTAGRDFALFLSKNGTGFFDVDLGGFVEITISTPWVVNTWNHFVVTADGTTWRVYLNGALVGSSLQAGLATNTAGRVYKIGSDTGTAGEDSLSGSIDQVSIANVVWSTARIAAVYALESSIPLVGAFSPIAIGSQMLMMTGCGF